MKQDLLLKSKKGMVENLGGLAMGLIAFGVIAVTGIVILGQMGKSVATCPKGFSFQLTNASYTNVCCNTSAKSCAGVNQSSTYGTPTTTAVYLTGQLGTTGLISWLPAIIALAIGVMFLGYFVSNKKY